MGKTTEEKIKELAKNVTDAAEPIIKNVTGATEPMIDDIIQDLRTKAEPIIKDVKTKTEPIIKDVKTKTEPVINVVKEKAEPAAKKASKAAKTVGDNISMQMAKRTTREEMYIQYNNHEIRAVDIMDKAKLDYISRGNKAADIEEIQVYVKPLDNAAYYVVNHSETGKIEL